MDIPLPGEIPIPLPGEIPIPLPGEIPIPLPGELPPTPMERYNVVMPPVGLVLS